MQQLTLSQVSLQKQPSSITEMYIPLWVMSSGTASTTATASPNLLQKGTTSCSTTITAPTKLHTLNPNWSPTQQFAFEVSMYVSNSSYAAHALLWDLTTNSLAANLNLATSSTTATLIRSPQVTLTPGHIYGVSLVSNNASATAYLTKAHLVAFLS